MNLLTVGQAVIHRVEETSAWLDIAELTENPAVVAANEGWLAPRFYDPEYRSFALVFQSWVVRLGGLTVVVDPCTGNGKARQVLTFFDSLNTPFLERFEGTGVRPAEVDLVFCTHLHCDHCGWNTRLRDGRWVPTFPRARYLFVRREYDRWDPRRPGHRAVGFNVGVFDDSVRPVVEAGQADLIDAPHALAPGLRVEPAYGHTAGHAVLHLASAGSEAYFTGDVFHHPLQVVRPELVFGGSDDPAAALATRHRLLARLADRRALMIPGHFQAPHCGWVRRAGAGFRFEPLA
jgi:glyoxylase-like metal-dependent hydrolase (beta-lactamase superfamily II)